ncbi:acyltransferase [Flavitalea sp. BT771]|uniref:acyltransferase family protein n=1 Tax=Flavitalea sp. BT771 TaxID=3063329 RepID=UPI0026E33B30|nr:acyltransferase [Flavitalea sp. BT771]MDO6431988.1 acyltransferase [Flavitalea sp. BT771]MDV6220897.1 acyltransferase [Flavitalea sp. BT771]
MKWTWLNKGQPLSDHLRDRRQNNFNLIRLAAALLVVMAHCYGNDDPIFKLSSGYLRAGTLGIRIFFFLSGLLVSRSLDQSPSRLNFVWKRVLRLYPAAIVAVVLCACVMGPLVTSLDLYTYFRHPLFYQYLRTCLLVRVYYELPGVFGQSPLGPAINPSLWTLSLELKLYAGLMLAGYIKNRKIQTALIVSLIVLLASASWYLYSVQSPGMIDFRKHFRLPYCDLSVFFLLGMLCNRFSKHIMISDRWLLLVLPACYLLIAVPFFCRIGSLILLPPVLLYLATSRLPWITKLTPRPDLSYGMYIFAFPMEQLIINNLHLKSPTTVFFLDILFSLPFALGSWYWVESKALQWKNKVGQKHV